MATEKNDPLEDILRDVAASPYKANEAVSEAKAKINALYISREEMLKALPEKSTAPAEDSSYTAGEIIGWNDAIDEIRKALKIGEKS